MIMASTALPHLFSISFLLLLLLAVAQAYQNVSLGISLTTVGGDYWLSPSGDFAFGFRPIDDKDLFLLSIWFNRIPDKTIVWYANGDNPAQRGSRVVLTTDGRLELTDPQGQVIWKADPIIGEVAYAAMLDNGNFVLASNDFSYIWESFKQPADTILPTQILEVGGVLSSRLAKTNYSKGRFQLRLLSNGNLVLNPIGLPTNSAYDPYFESGTSEASPIDSGNRVVFNESGAIYILGRNGNISNLTTWGIPFTTDFYYRATLDFDGVFTQYAYQRSSRGNDGNWSIVWSIPDNICVNIGGSIGSGACGYNSFCTLTSDRRPYCRCPPDYSFMDPNDRFSGCKPNFSQGCEKDELGAPEDLFEFNELPGINWPTSDYERLEPFTENECQNSCLHDCLCAVVVFGGGRCWKKKLPLSNGRFVASDTGSSKALFKVRKADSRPIPSTDKKNQAKVILVRSILLGSSVFFNFLLLAAISVVVFFPYHRKPKKIIQDSGVSETNLRSFSYEELEEATDGFKEELGKGSFGIVFKGVLPSSSSKFIAVKKLDRLVQEGEKEFKTEVSVIGQTHHKNLVRLLGFCEEGLHRLLVYEFMSNGSLASFLFGLSRPDWNQRVQIAIGIATGLTYLHEECCTQIIHCDIKPQNILLDDCFRARISDFGLAKLLMSDQTRTQTGIRGTRGYVAPEWFRNTPVTVKVDVYSFGVMLLEIICCRKSIELELGEEKTVILTDLAYDCYRDEKLDELVENDEEAMSDAKRLLTFLMVAIWCIQEEPSLRPAMKKVVQMLEGGVDVPCPPSPYPF